MWKGAGGQTKRASKLHNTILCYNWMSHNTYATRFLVTSCIIGQYIVCVLKWPIRNSDIWWNHTSSCAGKIPWGARYLSKCSFAKNSIQLFFLYLSFLSIWFSAIHTNWYWPMFQSSQSICVLLYYYILSIGDNYGSPKEWCVHTIHTKITEFNQSILICDSTLYFRGQ